MTSIKDIGILKWNAGLAQDIVDDVEVLPGWKENGALLGIHAVAGQIRDGLQRLITSQSTE